MYIIYPPLQAIIYFDKMEEKAKKPSLFKQRIAAFKPATNDKGFPQVVNILGPELNAKVIKDDFEQVAQSDKANQQKTLIDTIKKQSLLKEEDIKKIQQQNWAAVQAMSEQERQNMIKFIKSEMKESFINKIRKQPPQQPKQNIPIPPQPEKTQELPKQNEAKPQNNDDSWEFLLKLNIETDKLTFTEQNQENLVGVVRMIEMVGSDNNQSQIIGSKIVGKFVNLLTDTATSKSKELVLVCNVPLHLGIIFEKCSYLLFQQMIKKAHKTLFRSAFVEISTNIAQIITKIHKYMSKPHKVHLFKQLKELSDKCKSFKIDKQSMETLRSSLEVVCGVLQQHQNKVENQDWRNFKENADIILQLILLEQSDTSYFNTYALNILELVQKSSDLTEIVQVQSFVYEIISKLVLRKNKELYIDLQAFRKFWIPIIDILAIKLFSKITNIQLQIIFQLIFLARFAGGITWERIAASVQTFSQIKSMIPHFILFNTLSDQKSAGLREQNLQSLNSVFNWLANVSTQTSSKLNPNYILNTLLELFMQQEEYYSQLDQPILQKLLTSIAISNSANFNLIFTQEKVRTLITNYGFNSFGNQVFTNLLLIVAIKASSDLEALVLRELASRYTSNFIGAASRMKTDLPAIQGQKISTNQDIKGDILQSIKTSTISEQNLFLAYLKS